MVSRQLKIDKRRSEILNLLQNQGRIRVDQLCEIFGTTAVTVRNDLDTLAKEGKLIRINGGAILNDNTTTERAIPHLEEKEKIAEKVEKLINNGDALFINSGTTSLVVAKRLKMTKLNLNIVTNSLDVASEFGDVPTFRVILLGGEINAQYGFTYGSIAQEQLNLFGADWAILSVDGINMQNELTTYHAEEAIIDRIMINRATKVLVVADQTKIGRNGFSFIETCNDKISIITNED